MPLLGLWITSRYNKLQHNDTSITLPASLRNYVNTHSLTVNLFGNIPYTESED